MLVLLGYFYVMSMENINFYVVVYVLMGLSSSLKCKIQSFLGLCIWVKGGKWIVGNHFSCYGIMFI
jgi:hypothetical protein